MFMRSMRASATAVALLAGAGIAAAQGDSPSATTGVAPAERPYNTGQPSLAGEVIPSPQDAAAHNQIVAERDRLPILAHTFNFTPEQKQQIRDALASEKGGSTDVTAVAGTEIPESLAVKPVPDEIAQEMPAMKPYKYVKLGNTIAIVDPHLPVVVAVIE